MTVIYEGNTEIVELIKKGAKDEISEEELLAFIERIKDEKESKVC